MNVSRTLSLYIGRKYFSWLMITFFSLSMVVFVFDFVELLRRASNKPQATFDIVLQMGLLKLPNMMELLLPFAVLFGAMSAFYRLTRSQELVIARASGVSVWQFIFPTMILSFLLGIFMLTLFNPVASTMLARFEQLESRYLQGEKSQIAIIKDGVWLRQSMEGFQAVIHADRLSQQDMSLQRVTVFQFVNNDNIVGRIDAESANLRAGFWQLNSAYVSDLKTKPVFYETAKLPTNLTHANILDSFATPETLSFWQLPGFIHVLEQAGFSAIRHKLHLNTLYALPILLCAMVLIAASFSLRMPRRGQTTVMIIGGIFAGFLLYFLSDVVTALGISSRIPIVMAAWTPPVAVVLLGIAFLLHQEDG